MTFKLHRVVFLIFFALLFSTFSQERPEEILKNARKFYKEAKYDSTVNILKQFLKKYGKDPSTEHVVPLLMEALVRKNDVQYFGKLMSIYVKKFPQSDYLPRLFYLEGVILAREEKYSNAVLSFSESRNRGATASLDTLTLRNVNKICEKALTAAELDNLLRNSELNPQVREICSFYEMQKLYEQKRVLQARQKAEAFQKEFPKSGYAAFVKDLLNKTKSEKKNVIRIGLLSPISGEDADIGKQIVQGVQLAVEQYNNRGDGKIDLIINDTRGSMIETARLTDILIKQYEVKIIIGPVLSRNAVVTASMLMDRDIVMVTPTATDEGIARLGPNIFQLNVTVGMLGKQIARFALENLNIREYAIISPLSEYGRNLSSCFREEIEKGGGKIIDEEFFDEGTQDFRVQFENLRVKLAALREEKLALESGITYTGNKRRSASDSLYLIDSVMSIGGLFIPAESEDVVMLAPQVYFHRIQTQLLGSTGWHTSSTLLDGKKYVENAIISSNFEIDPNDEKWLAFNSAFTKRFNTSPGRLVAPLGYDAANLILHSITKLGGDDDPKKIAKMLTTAKDFQGVSGPISLDNDDGANSETAILKLKDKKFIRIK